MHVCGTALLCNSTCPAVPSVAEARQNLAARQNSGHFASSSGRSPSGRPAFNKSKVALQAQHSTRVQELLPPKADLQVPAAEKIESPTLVIRRARPGRPRKRQHSSRQQPKDSTAFEQKSQGPTTASSTDRLQLQACTEAAEPSAGSQAVLNSQGPGRRGRSPRTDSADGTSATPAPAGRSQAVDMAADLLLGTAEPLGEASGPTELIFRLERRGEGWGEEILPHLVIEQRPLQPPKQRTRKRSSMPEPWEEGSLERFLLDAGVAEHKINAVVEEATAWRVTPGGKPLIDRRRRSRVERNVPVVSRYLEQECGIPPGPSGVGQVLGRAPQIMLCKPSTNDRWDRRVVELAAFLHRYGHCNVPEQTWEESQELSAWVKRQRIAFAQEALSEERLQVLEALGFEFGQVAQLTDEWEGRFDQLLDWMLWNEEREEAFRWGASDWGARGGRAARELALWVQLQRTFRRRALLATDAVRRLDAIGFNWDPKDEPLAQRRWMQRLGQLLYVVECARHTHSAAIERHFLQQRLAPAAAATVAAAADPLAPDPADDGSIAASLRLLGSRPPRWGRDGGLGLGVAVPTRSGLPSAARNRPVGQNTVAQRRVALALAGPGLLAREPGLRMWVARQHYLWRHGRLGPEQLAILELTGLDMDIYTLPHWRSLAHQAAAFLTGSHLADGVQDHGDESDVAVPALSRPTRGRRRGRPSKNGSDASALTSSDEDEQAVSASGDSNAARSGGGSEKPNRLRILRWAMTQRALAAERRLSPQQFRYLTLLGITWLLSGEVMEMRDEMWQHRFSELQEIRNQPPRQAYVSHTHPNAALRDWLAHQKGLRALGILRPDREAALTALGVNWDVERGQHDWQWDVNLSRLLAFRRKHGHAWVYQRQGALGQWLARQRLLWRKGELPPSRIAQLSVLGVDISYTPDFAIPAAPPSRPQS